MKKMFLLLVVIFAANVKTQSLINQDVSAQIIYQVDVTNYQDDLFHVTVLTENLTPENNIYNFVSTTPGTYDMLDFGRFVRSFNAYDKDGNELKTNKLSTNRWQIKNPENLSKIVYKIEDSFDAEIQDHFITPMCGTGIQDNFIVLNTFGVLGYFEGLQSNPIRLKLDYDPDWFIGTAMDLDADGYYYAETYDRLADSPILLGELTNSQIEVNDIDVSVFLYCPDNDLIAEDILSYVNDVLQSAGNFIGYSPVPYYTFLMVLLDYDTFNELINQPYAGALEHSYSSLFFLPGSEEDLPALKDDMAHEFMHILTPLNLHSEIIHSFNFTYPTPSEHIWLYEGVTEWMSDIMQLRSGLITIEDFMQVLSEKLKGSNSFDTNISLSQMSLMVYDDIVREQFSNFYQRGALTATLLDIRLLELSKGTYGLREVLLGLLEKFGKEHPFPEKNFFKVLVNLTYPEIEDFINSYIKGSQPLPLKKYLEKIRIEYTAEKPSEDSRPRFGFGIATADEEEYTASKVSKEAYRFGVRQGDRIISLLGQEVNSDNLDEIIEVRNSMSIGDTFDMTVSRNGEEIKLTGVLLERKLYHIFGVMDSISPEQKFLREQWIKNLRLK
ncbi:MAG: peptidase [Ignavibacteria bacterium]|jgi:predicted metalloprotease with PDZ domain